jgi:hypothetical protein
MKSTQEKHNHKKVLPQTAFDLICGMEVDPALAKHRAEYNDEIYYGQCSLSRQYLLRYIS